MLRTLKSLRVSLACAGGILPRLLMSSAFGQQYRVDIAAQPGTVVEGYTIREFPSNGDGPVINDDGEVVFTALVTGPGGDTEGITYVSPAAGLFAGADLLATNDGTHDRIDSLYDPVSGAFLLHRVRLEALPESAGKKTGVVLSIGRLRMAIDNSTVQAPLPIRFGLGASNVSSALHYGTDGTDHAVISVAETHVPTSPAAYLATFDAGNDLPTVPADHVTVRRTATTGYDIAHRPATSVHQVTFAPPMLTSTRRGLPHRLLQTQLNH